MNGLKSPYQRRILNSNNLRYENNTNVWKQKDEPDMGRLTQVASVAESSDLQSFQNNVLKSQKFSYAPSKGHSALEVLNEDFGIFII